MLPNIASLARYGGVMRDYSAPVDGSTDEPAKCRNEYVCDVAAMGHTAPRAMRSFVGVDGGAPTDPLSGFVHDAMWGSGAAVKPTVVRAGEGTWDLTWPTTVDTELAPEPVEVGGGAQATVTVNFRRAIAQVESADGSFKAAAAKVTAPNVVRVYGYTGTTLDDLAGLTITVVVW